MTSKCNELYKNMMNLQKEKLAYEREYIHNSRYNTSHHEKRAEFQAKFKNAIPYLVEYKYKIGLFEYIKKSIDTWGQSNPPPKNPTGFKVLIHGNNHYQYTKRTSNDDFEYIDILKDCPIPYTTDIEYYYDTHETYYGLSDSNFNTINSKQTNDWVNDGKHIDKEYKDRQDQWWDHGGKLKMSQEIAQVEEAFQKCLIK
jgi:hypothetical protein